MQAPSSGQLILTKQVRKLHNYITKNNFDVGNNQKLISNSSFLYFLQLNCFNKTNMTANRVKFPLRLQSIEEMEDAYILKKDKTLRRQQGVETELSKNQTVDTSKLLNLNGPASENDRLHPTGTTTYHFQRRGSFLYRPESDNENGTTRTSRNSSFSNEGVYGEELITPFAQVLSSLQNIRTNFVMLTNIRESGMRRGSEGFHSHSCQLYEKSDGSMIRDNMFKKLTIETMKEFDWCLEQLETLGASMSISEMATNKFKKMLDRELKDFSETGSGGEEVSAYIYDNFLDKKIEAVTKRPNKPLRARSKSLVNSLARTVSGSGSVPRFGVDSIDDKKLEKLMENVDKWSFDISQLAVFTKNRPLLSITYTILQARDLLRPFKIRPWILANYINIIESHYVSEVSFHNSLHAADVVHATHCLLSSSVFEGVFNDLEMLAAIIASAIHDVDHPGVNNQFLVNTSSQMALMYNDESVLENHHLAVAFQLMQNDNCDILDSLSKSERQLFRKMVIEMVLATDNAKHMNILGSLKTMVETKRLSGSPVQLDTFNEKMHVLKCLVHCADLSNPTRPLDLYKMWVERLMEEFFRQGDIERERGMEISPMMDRQNPNVEKSQVVFIDYVVHPLWETWSDLVYPDAQEILDRLVTNREYYRSLSSTNMSGDTSASLLTTKMPVTCETDINDSSDDKNISSKKNVKLFQQQETERIELLSVKNIRRMSDTDVLKFTSRAVKTKETIYENESKLCNWSLNAAKNSGTDENQNLLNGDLLTNLRTNVTSIQPQVS
ncbi:3',5'-cyclic-AMP phosphodiesterase 4C isoform X8 [Hydra vulgaris]|uniref:Phosphodiesterase n=2 Tax=Hydra vulgaris TaxID=6087 RepID=A0ABM4C8E0_HYDVU